jgi:hypothetical protein
MRFLSVACWRSRSIIANVLPEGVTSGLQSIF